MGSNADRQCRQLLPASPNYCPSSRHGLAPLQQPVKPFCIAATAERAGAFVIAVSAAGCGTGQRQVLAAAAVVALGWRWGWAPRYCDCLA